VPFDLGAEHGGLSGSGSFAVSAPRGLLLETSALPTTASARFSVPWKYSDIGLLTWSSPFGVAGWTPLEFESQVVRLADDEVSSVGYQLAPGVILTVTELETTPAPPAPWDRAAQAVSQLYTNDLAAPQSETITWTYTVPSGKKLWLSSASVAVQLATVQSNVGMWRAWIERDSSRLVFANMGVNVVGAWTREDLSSGPVIMGAGSVLQGRISASGSGGRAVFTVAMAGFIFDA
jgi:hypothetical protein